MLQKKKLCKCGCGVEGFIWSSGFLKQCFLKSKPQKVIKKYSEKGLEKKKLKIENTEKLHTWFQKLWETEPHYSEISGVWLGNENSSAYWHHIIPKSSNKDAEFDRENIVRLTLDEHTIVEANPLKYELVNKKREMLKLKYE